MDCGVAGLRFVDLMYFLASWGCGLAFFEKKNLKYKCRNSDKNHVQNMWEILENPSKFNEHPSKIDPKRSEIEKNISLDRFRRQMAPRSAPGGFPYDGVSENGHLFDRKWRSEGAFWAPAGVQNPIKSNFLGLDRRRVPRKMMSWRGGGKNMKI